MGARVEGLGPVNFDILPRSFIVILRITFDFQRFLTQALRHNPSMTEFIPLEFLVEIRRH